MSTNARQYEAIDPHSVRSLMELIDAYGDARADAALALAQQRAIPAEAFEHANRVRESLIGYLVEICPQGQTSRPY